MTIELVPFGDDALRASLPEGVDARAILSRLRALEGAVDVVVTERHVLVTFDPDAGPPDVERVLAAAEECPPSEMPPPREHRVRVRYDGEDLDAIAARLGLTPADVIAIHVAATYRVSVIGFLPGFAYLRGLDERLAVPRRAAPRPRVTAGSVALAGPYTGIYPFASPGGWNIVGHARDFCAFDAHTGATLALGDRVRFVEDRS